MTTLKNLASSKNKKLTATLVAGLVLAIPLIVWSFPKDPPLGTTGAPGEGTCGNCHGGGSGGGSLSVKSSSGTTYKPGVKQHLTVTIVDPNASDWGYEMTAVRKSKPTTGAGTFKAVDGNSDVRKSGTKSYAAQINDLLGKKKKVTYKIDWTPPKKNVGKITLYLAGIGGVGDPSADSPYTSSLTLSPK
jgi:hypothetical protein